MKRVIGWIGLLVIVASIGFGVLALATPAEARGRCICPLVYAPVVCDHGRTYSNQCFADCRNAKNCVPADWFIF